MKSGEFIPKYFLTLHIFGYIIDKLLNVVQSRRLLFLHYFRSISLVGILGVACLCSMAEESVVPPVSLSVTSLDFGTVSPLVDNKRTITVTNTSDEVLSVTGVKGTCICIDPSFTPASLKPGESSTFDISLNLAMYPVNKIKAAAVVEIDGEPNTSVRVRGKVAPEYMIEPAVLDLGTIQRGSKIDSTLLLRKTGANPVKLKSVKFSDDDLKVTWSAVPPKKTDDKKETKAPAIPDAYSIRLQGEAPLTGSLFNRTVVIKTDVARIPEQTVRITARLSGIQNTVSPSNVRFSEAKAGDTLTGFSISGSEKLSLLEASSSNEWVNPVVKNNQVELHIADDAPQGKLIGKVTVKIQEGRLTETRTVTFMGSISS